MRPKEFAPQLHDGDERFVRDRTTEHVYHRVFHRVLYADTDRSGVVYHANYLRYFELGRASLMRDVSYPYAAVEEAGYIYPVIEVGLNFYHPLLYDHGMWIYTRPADIDRIRVKFDYVITHDETNTLICKGFTHHCAANQRGVPVAVDEMTVEAWKNFPK